MDEEVSPRNCLNIEEIAGQPKLVRAYELGRLWADLGFSFSERIAFPADRILHTQVNQSLAAYKSLFERVFPAIRPANIAELFSLWMYHYDDEAAHSEWASFEQRWQEDFAAETEVDECRRLLNQSLLTTIGYRHQCMDDFLRTEIGEASRDYSAFQLGLRMGECVFPPAAITEMFCLQQGARPEPFRLRVQRWNFSSHRFSENELCKLRDALWVMQQQCAHPEWQTLRTSTFVFDGAHVGLMAVAFLKFHDRIRQLLGELSSNAEASNFEDTLTDPTLPPLPQSSPPPAPNNPSATASNDLLPTRCLPADPRSHDGTQSQDTCWRRRESVALGGRDGGMKV